MLPLFSGISLTSNLNTHKDYSEKRTPTKINDTDSICQIVKSFFVCYSLQPNSSKYNIEVASPRLTIHMLYSPKSWTVVSFKSLIAVKNGCFDKYVTSFQFLSHTVSCLWQSFLFFPSVLAFPRFITDGRNVDLPIGRHWRVVPFSGIICVHCYMQQSFDELSWLPFW